MIAVHYNPVIFNMREKQTITILVEKVNYTYQMSNKIKNEIILQQRSIYYLRIRKFV